LLIGGKNTDFDNQLLEAKKLRYINFVEEATSAYDLECKLNVVFVDEYKDDNTKALAWIDVASLTIYVCLLHLREMPVERIRENAFHEVTHIFNQSHDPDFYKIFHDVMLKNWKPGNISGLTMRTGNTGFTDVDIKKHEPEVIDTVRCNYHLHREEAELTQCPYCKKYYCEQHIRPKQPHSFNSNEPDHDYSGHPCGSFDLFLKEDIEIKAKYDTEYKLILEFRRYAEQIYKKQPR
jgi:hypothetical protein